MDDRQRAEAKLVHEPQRVILEIVEPSVTLGRVGRPEQLEKQDRCEWIRGPGASTNRRAMSVRCHASPNCALTVDPPSGLKMFAPGLE